MKLAFAIRRHVSNILLRVDQLMGTNRSLYILCYHSFAASSNRYAVAHSVFAQQVARIARHYRFVGYQQIDNCLAGLPASQPEILLTIDDGLASVLSILPITQHYRIPVVLFVLADPAHANRRELDSAEPTLSWAQIKYLHAQGWEIGCHSATHADFSRLSPQAIEDEVVLAKNKLERKLGFPVSAFAYPKGFYNAAVVAAVIRAGYKHAFTIESNSVSDHTSPWLIPRTIVDHTHTITEIPAVISNSWLGLRRLTNKLKLWERFLS